MRYLLVLAFWILVAVSGTTNIYQWLHPNSESVTEWKSYEIREVELEERLGESLVVTDQNFGSVAAMQEFTEKQLREAQSSELLWLEEGIVWRGTVTRASPSKLGAFPLVSYVYWNETHYYETPSWNIVGDTYISDGFLYWSVTTGGTPNNLWWVIPALLLLNLCYAGTCWSWLKECGLAYKKASQRELPRPKLKI